MNNEFFNEFFKETPTTIPEMLSELIESQCEVKAFLGAIFMEMSKDDPAIKDRMTMNIDRIQKQELKRVIARFASQMDD